jgi:ankyrin repeat protein
MQRLFAVVTFVLINSSAVFAGPLFDAASNGDVATLEDLLNDGVDVDQPGRNSETPLMAAVLAGEAATAEMLITRGANIMARNKGGLTPLHAAAYSGGTDIALLLLLNGANIEDNANVSGASPLAVAAEEGSLGVAELLVDKGADMNALDRDGWSVLTAAWMKKRTGIVYLLKQHGVTCQPVEVLGTEEYHRKCVEFGK